MDNKTQVRLILRDRNKVHTWCRGAETLTGTDEKNGQNKTTTESKVGHERRKH